MTASNSTPLGLLVMAYGGPDSLDEVAAYLLDVRGGRPTSDEIIHEVRERYRAIGGRSPILERTQAQAGALEAALRQRGAPFRAWVGMRHWHPYIQAALEDMQAAGIERAVGLVMAPHYSRMSIGAYFKKVADAGSAVQVAPIERWHLLPGYIEALAEHVQEALRRFPADARSGVPVIFTAHSLPERILEWGDPYPDELLATVRAVAERLGQQPHEFAYQSAAMTPDPWLGPDAGEVISRLAADGARNVLIAPIGFVTEHVEILYDVDIDFKRQADSLGVRLERIRMLDSAPAMVDGLAELVCATAAEQGWL
jgi:protoporphyrin/coproporphyrin ferrochelatase